MRGQAERLFLCRPPHHRLRRSFPPRGSLPPLSPPLCKGRCLRLKRADGRVVMHARHKPLQPSRLASLGTLPYTGRARDRYYNAPPIQFCSSAKPLLNPATIAGFSFIQQDAPVRAANGGYLTAKRCIMRDIILCNLAKITRNRRNRGGRAGRIAPHANRSSPTYSRAFRASARNGCPRG